MSAWVQPLAAHGPDGDDPRKALPLAGSAHLWFARARVQEGAGTPREVAASALDAAMQRLLSAPRAPIAGLSMDRPRVMGILNVTPDSFSDGGDHTRVDDALARARVMAQSADILDIGGESTRPGADEVPVAEEIARVVPVIEAIRGAGLTTPISIDTRKAAVAEAALAAGADIINDVAAGLFDPEILDVAAAQGAPICLMHSIADPKTMQARARYDDVVAEVFDHLAERIAAAEAAGVDRARIITDPGIGFGKTLQHNLSILQGLTRYHTLGLPVLVGASRKRFIGTIGGAEAAKDRLGGSVAVALYAAERGAHILRVHDTYETRQALSLQLAMQSRGEWTDA